jgi:hypothetical protein
MTPRISHAGVSKAVVPTARSVADRVSDAAGKRVGTLHAVFTVTGGKRPRTSELSTGTFLLKDGQISGHGVVLNATREPTRRAARHRVYRPIRTA